MTHGNHHIITVTITLHANTKDPLTSNSWFPLTDTPPNSRAVRTTPALLGPLAT